MPAVSSVLSPEVMGEDGIETVRSEQFQYAVLNVLTGQRSLLRPVVEISHGTSGVEFL
jgi:hypothetical protein